MQALISGFSFEKEPRVTRQKSIKLASGPHFLAPVGAHGGSRGLCYMAVDVKSSPCLTAFSDLGLDSSKAGILRQSINNVITSKFIFCCFES